MRYVLCRRHKNAMNELNVSLQHSILTLAANGWSHRRIARELAIHRETVGRHLRLAGSKPAKVLTGSEPEPTAKPAIPLSGSEPVLESKPAIPLTGCLTAGRQSLCVPWQAVIESAVQAGLSAQRIYQDLICNHAFTGGYHSVQRFVRQLLQTQPVPFVRMEVEPGQEAQVDFGQGAWVLVNVTSRSAVIKSAVIVPNWRRRFNPDYDVKVGEVPSAPSRLFQ